MILSLNSSFSQASFVTFLEKRTKFKYRVFIKYCVFSKILKYIPNSGLSQFPLSVSMCTQWQVKHQHYCSRTGRVQKNNNNLRKNAIFNEHLVIPCIYLSISIFILCINKSIQFHSFYLSL